MDFATAFTYAFQDKDWLKKLGIAAAICLIPLVGLIAIMGWGLEITRRVINNQTDILPEWNDFGGFISKGFQGFVVSLAFMLPSILLNICQQALNVGSTSLASSNSSASNLSSVATIAVMCLSCVSIILSLAGNFVLPAALSLLADKGQLSAAFNFHEVIGLVRAAPGPYVLQMIVVGVAGAILGPIGLLVCVVGLLAVIAFMATVSYHLYGQSYKLARAAQGASTPTF